MQAVACLQHGKHADRSGLQAGFDLAGRHADGDRRGAADQVALRITDAEILQHRQFGCAFDAFRDHAGMRALGQLPDRAHELDLVGILMDIGDEMLVDLDEGGFQFRPHAQAGKAFPEIVEGHLDAHCAQAGDRLAQEGVIQRGRILGDFDHHLMAGQADVRQRRQHRLGREAGVQQAAGRQVHEQSPRQFQLGKSLECRAHARPVQIGQQTLLFGHAKQGLRRMQRTVRRPARQGLIPHHASVNQVEHRLQQGHQPRVVQDVYQMHA